MKKAFFATAFLLVLIFSTQAWSQSSFATVSGTVQDATGALIPGVSVTATNNATGIVTTVVSNETGSYNIPSLLPGVYKVSAELPGFQTHTYTDVALGNAVQVRLNFTLRVASVAQAVEVTVAADTLLATSSPSVSDVLNERKVQDLPIVGNDALDLILVLNGVANINENAFGQEGTTFAGVSAREINIQRDGISVNESRFPTGVRSATRLNPELVGEIRMILSPVDVEMGRGNAQIQVQTRSGTNDYRGSAVWSFRNTAFDANTWSNNRVQPNAVRPGYTNRHQVTLSYGGPIIKNKTFFFAVWDQLKSLQRSTQNPLVLTPCARRGIFRYFDSGTGIPSWNNGNATSTTNTGNTPATAVVDVFGNPKPPATNPNGSPFTGTLRYVSVFGPVTNIPTQPDCSDAVIGSAPTATGTWDPYRTKVDQTGYVAQVLKLMPAVNNYEAGGSDGLNTAGFRWVRRLNGSDNIYGLDESTPRKQINVKIDHNFNTNHKANVSWSYERNDAADYFMNWPDTTQGRTFRRPDVWTTSFTSTLSPNIVNEARFGYRVTGTNITTPWDNPQYRDRANELTPYVNKFRLFPQFGTGAVNFQFNQPIGNRGAGPYTNVDKTPLWTYGDTLSWTKGTHAFKSGAEIRLSRSKSYADGYFGAAGGASTYARAIGGELTSSLIAGINGTNMPGLAGTATTGNQSRMEDLLTFLTGSIATVSHRYFINSPSSTAWDDFRTSPYIVRDFHQNEFALFFKDDWKVHKNLTLNLGLRYEYYGVPFINSGTTLAPVGGGAALFGISGRGFDSWMRPGPVTPDLNLLTKFEFVGPNSPNGGKSLFPNDRNNFGPAVGFSWQVPWFGAGKTTLRGGYQVTYQGGGQFYELDTQGASNPPGSNYIPQYQGLNVATGVQKPYLNFQDALNIVPIPPLVTNPLQTVPLTDRAQVVVAFDPSYQNPYTQNLTLSLTRSLRKNMVLDVRYVGTMQVKGFRDLNINLPNFLYNGLKEAFDSVRAGGESALLDAMFQGLNIAGAGFGPVGTVRNGVPQTASLHMRNSTTFNTNLANGNYQALASSLNTLVINPTNNPGVPGSVAGLSGSVLRYSGKFPENFIVANPQFGNTVMKTNLGHTNYHSLQTQFTLRPTNGITYQGTYTWSRALGTGQAGTGAQGIAGSAPGYTNPVDRRGDYTLQSSHRLHEFRMNGTFELPIGPGKLALGNSSGVLARILERWQMGWIANLSSGAPVSIGAQNMLYASGVPDAVGPFSNKFGKVKWGVPVAATGQLNGTYFEGETYVSVNDPQCSRVAANLTSLCTIDAIARVVPAGTPGSFVLSDGTNRSAQIVLQNPLPGTRGNLGQFTMENAGTWRFDANMSKSFHLSETKSLQIRIDTNNVLNHPSPGSPALNINNTNFGEITNKSGNRQFQGQLRLSF